MSDRLASLIERYRRHPGRGGCGVGAVVDLARPSHEVIELALGGLGCMEHRGGAIEDTGDGAGLLLRTDQKFFRRFIAPGRRLPEGHRLVVGVVYFPSGEESNLPAWQQEIDATVRRRGLQPLGWRRVPVDESALGQKARASRRDVWQILIGEGMIPDEELAAALFSVKHHLERWFRDLYLPSLSPSTLVYKALATGDQLRRFYPDLSDPELESDLAVFHRRYSTNTFSNWYLAQTFRLLCHNGEINTIKANRNAVKNLEAEVGRDGILMPQGSDSADLDRVIELFAVHKISLPEALCRVMPLAWSDLPEPTPEVVRFYQGVARALGTLGAWEGPAAVVASDGDYVVAMLDRMGLRPLRWLKTRSNRVIIGSELGAIPIAPEEIVETGQLDPGEGIAIDLKARTLNHPRELIREVVAHSPINFQELAESQLVPLPPRQRHGSGKAPKPDRRVLNLFGWSQDRIRTVKYMAENGKEPITSMGFDRPLGVFSPARPPLAKYFKQIVAVVTNPPIDPLREGSAFDLTVYLGKTPSVHEAHPNYEPQPQYRLDGPFLVGDQLLRIRDGAGAGVPDCIPLDATFEDVKDSRAIARRVSELVRDALKTAKSGGASIVLISDRAALLAPKEDAARRLPLPMLLPVAAIHNALTEAGLRRSLSIVVESGEVQEGHDAALLVANGADAIHPYLMLELAEGDAQGERNLIAALDGTLRRVMSKMGITTVDGYRGSRLFEAVGVSAALVDYYLPGIQSRIGGIDLDDLYEDLVYRASQGGSPHRETEVNVYRKEVWQELQETARGNEGAYERFLRLIRDTPPVYLRDLLRWKRAPEGAVGAVTEGDVALPEEIIRACFRGAAMSHGALHRTAHRAIAAAFNSFDAASNCGEGGEDPRRDRGGEWESDRSRIRQVGSGRFGVEARYLAHADEIQIKIGQGAKPGEGGMLPGAKVTEEIARIRRTQVGVTLISPPPHHDIYSIEDLAQLIYNLRQVNPRARVSVKIPAVTDIGTITVGIAKAGADVIDVSGFEGGTGAAASSSIEHAGLPLERALAEAHQALVVNGIRDTVRLRADGGLKTGEDVAKVLALGADEVSLGTALMIAEQCIFCHGCSKGNCPAGITTQSDLTARRLMTEKKGRAADDVLPDLEEERYRDALSGVTRYLTALASDLRTILGRLGLQRPEELVGRVDLLEQVVTGTPRLDKVDLSELLVDPYGNEKPAIRRGGRPRAAKLVDPTSTANAAIMEAVRRGEREVSLAITTGDRAVGATLAGFMSVAGPHNVGLALSGFAGQALGFALTDGARIELVGFANDSVGAAMSGGTLVVRQPAAVAPEVREHSSVIGNNACYGATGGRLFVEGRSGQRLGVRNSGAVMVCEGAGKYAFEYMTGGVGVVLGPVGAVLGSGMTGGAVWILGDRREVEERLHRESVEIAAASEEDLTQLRALVQAHADETQSPRARALLEEWDAAARRFVKVVPAKAAQPQVVPVTPDHTLVALSPKP